MADAAAGAADGSSRIAFDGTAALRMVFQTATAALGINHGTAVTSGFTTASKPEPKLHSRGGANLSASTPEAGGRAVTALAEAVTKPGQAQAVVGRGQNPLNFAARFAATPTWPPAGGASAMPVSPSRRPT